MAAWIHITGKALTDLHTSGTGSSRRDEAGQPAGAGSWTVEQDDRRLRAVAERRPGPACDIQPTQAQGAA